MAGISKVILIEILGRDPETRYTPSGAMNINFSMAVSRRWNDQSGQPQERTTWFNITAWRRLAETLNTLAQQGALVKGKQVYVSGTIESREYVDRQGNPRTSLDVTADELQLLGSRGDSEGGFGGQRGPDQGFDGGPEGGDINDVPF